MHGVVFLVESEYKARNVELRPECKTDCVLVEPCGSFLLKMLQLRLNGFTVSMFYSAKALFLAGGKGIISCLCCCLCAVLADDGLK